MASFLATSYYMTNLHMQTLCMCGGHIAVCTVHVVVVVFFHALLSWKTRPSGEFPS